MEGKGCIEGGMNLQGLEKVSLISKSIFQQVLPMLICRSCFESKTFIEGIKTELPSIQ